MNTKNLLNLAEFLETEITDKQFDMKYYRDKEFISVHDCGTVGCALGWAPLVEGLEHLSIDMEYESFVGENVLDFYLYSTRVFGELDTIKGDKVHDLLNELDVDTWGLDWHNPFTLWDFIFSDEWSSVPEQKTRQATANRIRVACERLIR